MHAFALGYYKREHRVHMMCFTLESEGLVSFADEKALYHQIHPLKLFTDIFAKTKMQRFPNP